MIGSVSIGWLMTKSKTELSEIIREMTLKYEIKKLGCEEE